MMNLKEKVMNNVLKPMFAYQGGKTKLADKIYNEITSRCGKDVTFVDVCCGGGSVSVEFINNGLHPENIYMFDSGAIGAFWQQVSEGTFDLDYFEYIIHKIPSDLENIKGFMEDLSKIEYGYVGDVVSEYLLLQASAFGGKQIYDLGCKFSNTSFRSYWKPTETSSRRSPVNPMMPMPSTLLDRVKKVVNEMQPIKATHTYAENIDFSKIKTDKELVIYIDPPYKGTTGYKDNIDLSLVINNAKCVGAKVFVSEYYNLSEDFIILSDTTKGGISGDRKGSMVEYLSIL
jgi:site-specific DNA-adenine methylase